MEDAGLDSLPSNPKLQSIPVFKDIGHLITLSGKSNTRGQLESVVNKTDALSTALLMVGTQISSEQQDRLIEKIGELQNAIMIARKSLILESSDEDLSSSTEADSTSPDASSSDGIVEIGTSESPFGITEERAQFITTMGDIGFYNIGNEPDDDQKFLESPSLLEFSQAMAFQINKIYQARGEIIKAYNETDDAEILKKYRIQLAGVIQTIFRIVFLIGGGLKGKNTLRSQDRYYGVTVFQGAVNEERFNGKVSVPYFQAHNQQSITKDALTSDALEIRKRWNNDEYIKMADVYATRVFNYELAEKEVLPEKEISPGSDVPEILFNLPLGAIMLLLHWFGNVEFNRKNSGEEDKEIRYSEEIGKAFRYAQWLLISNDVWFWDPIFKGFEYSDYKNQPSNKSVIYLSEGDDLISGIIINNKAPFGGEPEVLEVRTSEDDDELMTHDARDAICLGENDGWMPDFS